MDRIEDKLSSRTRCTQICWLTGTGALRSLLILFCFVSTFSSGAHILPAHGAAGRGDEITAPDEKKTDAGITASYYKVPYVAPPADPGTEPGAWEDSTAEPPPQYVTFVTPSSQLVTMVDGDIKESAYLEPGDAVYMSRGKVGVVQSITRPGAHLSSTATYGKIGDSQFDNSQLGDHVELRVYMCRPGQNIRTAPENPPAVDGAGDEVPILNPAENTGIRHKLEGIINQYPLETGMCSKSAREIYQLLIVEGFCARVGRMDSKMNAIRLTADRPYHSRKADRAYQLPYHEFVRIGDFVFDAIAGPGGMPWQDYAMLFNDGKLDDESIRLIYYTPITQILKSTFLYHQDSKTLQ